MRRPGPAPRSNNYPPDREKAAIDLVIKQMENLAHEWPTKGTPGN
ncbi:hypothetical protein [Streptomyces phaeochromogenes]